MHISPGPVRGPGCFRASDPKTDIIVSVLNWPEWDA